MSLSVSVAATEANLMHIMIKALFVLIYPMPRVISHVVMYLSRLMH